jgi:hypothetical protein
MKKSIALLFFIFVFTHMLEAQVSTVTVSGTYDHTPLKEFINELEQKFPVHFYFEEKVVDPVTVTATFGNIPLNQCLEKIFEGLQIYFQVSDDKIVIYAGFALAELFPGSQYTEEAGMGLSNEKKLSKEKQLQLQYQIINVGVPGRNKTRTAVVSGHLINFNTGEPVIGGNVYVNEIQKGAASDVNGFYSLALPLGNQTLMVSCIGMESTKRNINLYSDGRLDVEMLVNVKVLDDAVILGHGKGNLGQMHTGMEKIDILTIKSIPSLLGEADVIKSVLTLPGVQTVGEGTAGFNVRGGNTDENLILIDQAPIYYPSHFFGNFSAINSEIIENATLYKGSIPVRYGGRISSVLEINTIEGNHEKISGSAGISPISARINIDGPVFSKKSTFLTSFRSTYSNWILSKIKVPELYNSKASFYDAQAKLDLYLNEKNNILLNFYSSNDKFQLHSDTAYNYNNLIASMTWKHKYNPRFKSGTSLIYSLFNYSISNENSTNESFRLVHSLSDLGLNNDFEYFTNTRMKLNFGADLNFFSVNPGERKVLNYSNITPVSFANEHALEFGIYAGTEYNVSGRLKIEGGVRLSGLLSFDDGKEYLYAKALPYEVENIIDTIFSNKNSIRKTYVNPEWRFSLNYSAGRYSSIKFSYNRTAQYIHMLSNTTAISPTDTWKLSDKYLLPAVGDQLSAGYFKNIRKSGIEASAEIFYKWVNNIKEYKAGADLLLNDHVETEIVNGQGRSYGLELSIEKSGGHIYGRIDYTFSRALIKSVSDFKEELINDGEYFPANYDKPHNLNVMANFKASRRLIISAAMNYSTGRPITYPVAKYQLGDEVFLQYSKYNQYRISNYFRTDVSLTVNGNLKKHQKTHSSLTFSLYNVTGRKNAYSVYFKSEGGKFDAYQLSIFGTVIPSITYNIKF